MIKNVIAFIILVTLGVSLFFTVKLFSNLNPGVDGLLKNDNVFLRDHLKTYEKFPYVDDHFIFINTDSKRATQEFTDQLIKEIEAHNSSLVHFVVHDLGNVVDFLKDNDPLFWPSANLKMLRLKLEKIIKNKESIYFKNGKVYFNPLVMSESRDEKLMMASLRLNSLFSRMKRRGISRIKSTPHGRLMSVDGRTAGIYIKHTLPITNSLLAEEFESYIKERIEVVKRKFEENVDIQRVGISQTLVHEYNSIWSSLKVSLIWTVVVVLALLLFFYKNVKIVFSLLFTVTFSTLLTFAFSYIFFKELNTNTLYLCVLIIGNGINAGIIYFAYLFKRLPNEGSYSKKLKDARVDARKPTFIACLASICAYGVLVFSELKGYRDFGFIGVIGTLLSWGISLYLIPTLLSFNFLCIRNYRFKSFSGGVKGFSNFVFKARYITLSIIAIAFISNIFGLVNGVSFLETNLKKLKSRSLQKYSISSYQEEFDKLGFSPSLFPSLIIYSDNSHDLSSVYKDIAFDKKIPDLLGEFRPLSLGIFDFADRDRTFNEMKKILNIPNLKGYIDHHKIYKSEEELIRKVIEFKNHTNVKIEDFPEKILQFFRGKNGELGNILYLSFDLSSAEKNLNLTSQALRRIEEITSSYSSVSIGGGLSIVSEVVRLQHEDSLYICISAFVLILIIFMKFYWNDRGKLFSITTSFILTMFIFISLFIIFDLKVSVLSFIAIPLTFGIGVDYAINLAGHKEEEFSRNNFELGFNFMLPHICLASLTTIIGYIGMILNGEQQALFNFGLLCLIGEIITLFGAIFILPHIFYLFKNRLNCQ